MQIKGTQEAITLFEVKVYATKLKGIDHEKIKKQLKKLEEIHPYITVGLYVIKKEILINPINTHLIHYLEHIIYKHLKILEILFLKMIWK